MSDEADQDERRESQQDHHPNNNTQRDQVQENQGKDQIGVRGQLSVQVSVQDGINFDFYSHQTDTDNGQASKVSDVNLPAELRTMEDIHKTFSTVIEEFRGDKSAIRFIDEYEKMYGALKKSHKELKDWQFRCSNLANEIKNNTERVNLAIHLSQEDKGMIAALNKQVTDAWAMNDILLDRERKAKLAVSSMKQEINVLSSLVEEGMGLEELQKLAEKSGEERKEMESIISELKEQIQRQDLHHTTAISNARTIDEMKSKQIIDMRGKIAKLKAIQQTNQEKLDENKDHIFKIERTKNKLTSKVKILEDQLELWKAKYKLKDELNNDLKFDNQRFVDLFNKQKAREQNLAMRLDTQELFIAAARNQKTQLESQIYHLTKVQDQNRMEIVHLEKEISSQEKDLKTAVRSKDQKVIKIVRIEHNLEACQGVAQEKDVEISHLEISLAQTEKELHNVQQNLKTVLTTLNGLQKIYVDLKQKEQKCEISLIVEKHTTIHLEKYLSQAFDKIKEVESIIKHMQKEKERLVRHENSQRSAIAKLEGDIHTKELMNFSAQGHISSLEHDLKSMRGNLVTAINQRDWNLNMLKKTESMNKELMIVNTNVEKQAKFLAEDVLNQEAQITKLTQKFLKCRTELNETHNSLILEQIENKKRKEEARDMQREMRYIEKLMEEQKHQMDEQTIRMEEILRQRNILGAIVVKNKQEIKMLIDKNDVLGEIYKTGNKVYDRRMNEIKALQVQNTNLFRHKQHLMKQLHNTNNLRSKLGLANQQLVKSQARCKAIEEQPPMHIHKWQRMKVKDQSKYELVLKTNHLVKRLIQKSCEVSRLEGELLDKAQLVDTFKSLLAKAPGPEVAVKASVDRKSKEDMKKKLKCALAEMNMVQWKVEEREEERDILKQQLNEERQKRLKQGRQFEKIKNEEAKNKLKLPPIAAGFTVVNSGH